MGMDFKRIALSIGIAIVLSIFVGFFAYQVGASMINEESRDSELLARNAMAITALVLGIIFIVAGIFMSGFGAVSGGFIGGGMISCIESIVMYWNRLEGWGRVIAIGLLLVALIALGVWKLSDKSR